MATVVPAQVISTGSGGPGLVALAGILGSHEDIHIRQQVPRMACAEMCGCEIKNKYFISAGKDGKGQQLLEAAESGNCCDRVCCKPLHSRAIYVYPTGMSKEQSILTIDHPGNEFCICTAAKPCLGCCPCMECCADGVNVYDGYVDGKAGKLSGNIISAIKQPTFPSGCLTPTLVVDGKTFIEGPTCFGGWSECCCESEFMYSTSKGKSGDIASFKHLRPKDCGGVCREACTDSDNFGVNFKKGVTAEQKADAISSAMLVDFMFFERDQGLCHIEDSVMYCTCCLMYCCGVVVPCNIPIPLKQGGGGAPPSAENAVGAPPSAEEEGVDGAVQAEPPMEREAPSTEFAV